MPNWIANARKEKTGMTLIMTRACRKAVGWIFRGRRFIKPDLRAIFLISSGANPNRNVDGSGNVLSFDAKSLPLIFSCGPNRSVAWSCMRASLLSDLSLSGSLNKNRKGREALLMLAVKKCHLLRACIAYNAY